MSACTRYPDDEVVLQYVTGDLDEPELVAFEDHLFACDPCLARVERYQAAQQVLSTREIPSAPVVVASGGAPPRRPRPAASPGGRSRSRPACSSRWRCRRSTCARRHPSRSRHGLPRHRRRQRRAPPSAAVRARSGSRCSRWSRRRRTSRSRRAATATRASAPRCRPTRAPTGPWPRASWPPSRRPKPASIRGLPTSCAGTGPQRVAALDAVRASGQQPYARESLFYLGKAALQRGDVAAAQASFTAAREAGAGPAGEAARMLASLVRTHAVGASEPAGPLGQRAATGRAQGAPTAM